ncbi:MAG: Opacity-associated protein OapB [Pasteurellaceae bacterium]|nr:Opacity-associated protein OapB [Pasteurellaceae bacterium]
MKRTTFLVCHLLAICSLNACVVEVKPLETEHNRVKAQTVQDLEKTTQKGVTTRYRCHDHKEVKVVQVVRKNSKNKTAEVLTLTYANISEKLRPTVAEIGKKYTNIHWQWEMQNYTGKLSTIVGVVLAENCVKQP